MSKKFIDGNREGLNPYNKKICPGCRQKTTTLVKLTDRGTLTRTKTEVCQNKKCSLFIELAGLKNWWKYCQPNYRRDFRTQNSLKYQADKRRHYKPLNALEIQETMLCF